MYLNLCSLLCGQRSSVLHGYQAVVGSQITRDEGENINEHHMFVAVDDV